LVPTFNYENKVTVNAPVDHAWAVFSDVDKMDKWLVGFKSVAIISGNQGEVGSKYHFVFEDRGEIIELTETLTAVTENELFAFELDADPMTSDVEIKFAASDETTEITATSNVEGKNIFWKSLLWLSKSMMIERGQESYDNLKKLIEETPQQREEQLTTSDV